MAGVAIVVFACFVAFINTCLLLISHLRGKPTRSILAITQPNTVVSFDRIRLELGRMIAYSLEFLIAADVIETLLKPMHDVTMEDLYKLGLVACIRTLLAYFLGKEIEEIEHHVHEEHGHAEHGKSHGKIEHATSTAAVKATPSTAEAVHEKKVR